MSKGVNGIYYIIKNYINILYKHLIYKFIKEWTIITNYIKF
jgi:hypothetical protein